MGPAAGSRASLRVLLGARDHMTFERTAKVNALTALLRSVDLGVDARSPSNTAWHRTGFLSVMSYQILISHRDKTQDTSISQLNPGHFTCEPAYELVRAVAFLVLLWTRAAGAQSFVSRISLMSTSYHYGRAEREFTN